MTEEIKPQDEQTQAESKDTGIDKDLVRSHPLFLSATSAAQKKADKAMQELEALKAQVREQEDSRTKKKLEEEGNYKLLLEQNSLQHERELIQLKSEITKRDLREKLRDNNATNKVFLDWAADRYDGSIDMDEFVNSLKENEEHASFFSSQISKGGATPPGSVSPGTRAPSEKSLDERLASRDPAVRTAAMKERFAQLTGQ